MRACVHTCACMCVHRCVHVCAHRCVYVCCMCAHMCIHVHVCACIDVCMCAYIGSQNGSFDRYCGSCTHCDAAVASHITRVLYTLNTHTQMLARAHTHLTTDSHQTHTSPQTSESAITRTHTHTHTHTHTLVTPSGTCSSHVQFSLRRKSRPQEHALHVQLPSH